MEDDSTLLAIKLLTDLIISTTLTLQRVSSMKQEEVEQAIKDAEAMLDLTREKYKHRNKE
jgi:hypothetical protein